MKKNETYDRVMNWYSSGEDSLLAVSYLTNESNLEEAMRAVADIMKENTEIKIELTTHSYYLFLKILDNSKRG